MKQEDIEIFNALQYHEDGYYFYIVPTSVRRSGQLKVSVKKYNKLKDQFNKIKP